MTTLYDKRFSRRLDDAPDTFASFDNAEHSHSAAEAKKRDDVELLYSAMTNPPHPWKIDFSPIGGSIFDIRHFRDMQVKDVKSISSIDVRASSFPMFVGSSTVGVGTSLRTISRQEKEVILEGLATKGRFTDKTLWNAPVVVGDMIGNFQIFDARGTYRSIIGTYIEGVHGLFLTYPPNELAKSLELRFGLFGFLNNRQAQAASILQEAIAKCTENITLFQACAEPLGGMRAGVDLLDDVIAIAKQRKTTVRDLLMSNALRL